MEDNKPDPSPIDEYIARYPQNIQQILARIRVVIRETAPEAEERLSYNMPAFYLNGGLVWFAANKHHIGFYPRPSTTDEAFNQEIATYKGTKGSIHFPLDQPIPYEFIRKVVRVRLAENTRK
jgi:uncharacterized protein YdhG (YjbR/CyaY superfamily)